jgi:hypothetical protein
VPDDTKKEHAELRRLATMAYERELGGHIAELDKSFTKWRQGKLLSSELSNEIHEFHQHAARDTWSAYQIRHTSIVVARAIALGIPTEQEVPATLREKLSGTVAAFAGEDDRAV